MSLKTKQEICDEIRYETYAGINTNDASISLNFILRKLNDKIAAYALKSATLNYQVDGYFEADGMFRMTYTNLTLTQDQYTGVKYTPLPVQPAVLPRNRSFEVFPLAQRGGIQSSLFKMINREEVTYVRSLPSIKKVFCFEDSGNMNFVDSNNILAYVSAVNISIVTGGMNNLTDSLNLPGDMIDAIKREIVAECRAMIGIKDMTPLPASDSPQPRE
jgi:hypothetical protein